jgi:hypothetical protein
VMMVMVFLLFCIMCAVQCPVGRHPDCSAFPASVYMKGSLQLCLFILIPYEVLSISAMQL